VTKRSDPRYALTIPFTALAEERPGPVWSALFNRYWPSYKRWYLSQGIDDRPTYLACRRALKKHMPELIPVWEACREAAGASDLASRFLSMYRPPPYIAGCSQAVWRGGHPVLVRNYDYYPSAIDAVVLHTRWNGTGVIAMSDGLIGVLDGINEHGLVVSLTFGGRRDVGRGFGVPMILRYLLQTCRTVREATKQLKRLPCHMAYNVTLLDRTGQWATCYLNPDREAVVTKTAVATNHQSVVEWRQHAQATASVERELYLLKKLQSHRTGRAEMISAFLRPPLYSLAFERGYGTIYTAIYEPESLSLDLRWPGLTWRFDFEGAQNRVRQIQYPVPALATAAR